MIVLLHRDHKHSICNSSEAVSLCGRLRRFGFRIWGIRVQGPQVVGFGIKLRAWRTHHHFSCRNPILGYLNLPQTRTSSPPKEEGMPKGYNYVEYFLDCRSFMKDGMALGFWASAGCRGPPNPKPCKLFLQRCVGCLWASGLGFRV